MTHIIYHHKTIYGHLSNCQFENMQGPACVCDPIPPADTVKAMSLMGWTTDQRGSGGRSYIQALDKHLVTVTCLVDGWQIKWEKGPGFTYFEKRGFASVRHLMTWFFGRQAEMLDEALETGWEWLRCATSSKIKASNPRSSARKPRRMTKKNSDHVVIDIDGDGGFLCEHCGTTAPAPWPISIDDAMPVMNKFISEHIDCGKTVTFRFYGRSDGLVAVENIRGDTVTTESYTCADYGSIAVAKFIIGKEMKVFAVYDGCWMFALGQVEKNRKLPDWEVSVHDPPVGNTRIMNITAPSWAKLECVNE